MFARAVGDGVTISDHVTASGRGHLELSGRGNLSAAAASTAHLELAGHITATGRVDPAPHGLIVTGLGLDVTHGIIVTYADLTDEPDAACAIEVRDLDGTVLVSGIGDTAADALAQVFEHMLPPSSEEYLPGDDGMPDHGS